LVPIQLLKFNMMTPSFWSDLCQVGPADGLSQTGLFSTLPPEIRLMIYNHVFFLPHAEHGPNAVYIKEIKACLGILRRCSVIYWEARLIPFQRNIFNFCGTAPRQLRFRHEANSVLIDATLALKFVRSLRPWQAKALAGVVTHASALRRLHGLQVICV
jgi:hypothetical protein